MEAYFNNQRFLGFKSRVLSALGKQVKTLIPSVNDLKRIHLTHLLLIPYFLWKLNFGARAAITAKP